MDRSAGAADLAAVNLCDRKHRLSPTTNLIGLALQDGLEAAVAKLSRHGDPPIYDAALFPWIAEIEAEWRKIRAELDQVMRFCDDIPGFHGILKEVSTIATADHWKTFPSPASA